MNFLIGIDIGTSSTKTILMNTDGVILAKAQESYPIDVPEIGRAEQSPEIWWRAVVNTLQEIVNKTNIDTSHIRAVGLSGQMHGLVLIDEAGELVRPAIVWSDQRSKTQVEFIKETVQKENHEDKVLNAISTGFALPSLLWVKDHEPENYEKADKLLLPKDYIRYKLTGKIATESTDASGTLAFNIAEREWNYSLIRHLGLRKALFPKCYEPVEVAGEISQEAARITGLREGTPVVFGGGDQFMQGIGNGIHSPGMVSSNIGTGGQVAAVVDRPVNDAQCRTNLFCHVQQHTWNIQGSSLNSGLSFEWLKSKILRENSFAQLTVRAEKVAPGSEGLLFLPYLTGERTPYLDPNAKGMFFGLTLKHTADHLIRSVMEGVIFSLRDSLEIIESLGIKVNQVVASGGGAKSRLWLQMQADIFQKQIVTTEVDDEACVGAAIVAGVGVNVFPTIAEACQRLLSMSEEIIEPIEQNITIYDRCYVLYRQLYKSNKSLFQQVFLQ